MRNNFTSFGQSSSVAECDDNFGTNPWDDTVGNTGDVLSYSDPDSPWSSFAPETPPGGGIVISHMPLTPQGSCFGISGDHPEENEDCSMPGHHDDESPTVDPIHLDMSQYQATCDTGVHSSGSYINPQACPYPPFSGVGPSGPPHIPHTHSIQYTFDQLEAYQATDIALTRGQDFNQYNSAVVAGAHAPHCYASSA